MSSPPVDDRWAARFPRLFAEARVDYADCDLGFTTGPVPEALVSRLHLVAATREGGVVACRSVQGWRSLPGGTREPGESLVELARRELPEEAGARMTGGIELFAAHVAHSRRARPYRPHLPHPRSYWAYAVTARRWWGRRRTRPTASTWSRCWCCRRTTRPRTSRSTTRCTPTWSAWPRPCACSDAGA